MTLKMETWRSQPWFAVHQWSGSFIQVIRGIDT